VDRLLREKPSNVYRKRFFEAHGLGPFTCFDCHKPIELDDVLVHHVDLNHSNNVLENLVPAHSKCHLSYHNRVTGRREGAGWPKGRPHPAVSESNRRRSGEKRPPLTEEHKAKLREARRRIDVANG
jgi:5-methylcytosine-specific restriction endonuclease McrA